MSPAHLVARYDFPSSIWNTILGETDGTNLGQEAGYHHAAPLAIASEYGREDIVRCILQRQDLVIESKSGLAALRCAVSGGDSRIVDLLLADPWIDPRADVAGSYSVLFACRKTREPDATIIFKLFPYRPSIYANAQGPWAGAVLKQMVALVPRIRCLLKHPGLDVNARAPDNVSALDVAVMKGDIDILGLLLQHPALDIAADRRCRN